MVYGIEDFHVLVNFPVVASGAALVFTGASAGVSVAGQLLLGVLGIGRLA